MRKFGYKLKNFFINVAAVLLWLLLMILPYCISSKIVKHMERNQDGSDLVRRILLLWSDRLGRGWDGEDVRPTRQPFSHPSDGSHLRPTRVVRRSSQYQTFTQQNFCPSYYARSVRLCQYLLLRRPIFFVKLFTMKSVPQKFSFVKCFYAAICEIFHKKNPSDY